MSATIVRLPALALCACRVVPCWPLAEDSLAGRPSFGVQQGAKRARVMSPGSGHTDLPEAHVARHLPHLARR